MTQQLESELTDFVNSLIYQNYSYSANQLHIKKQNYQFQTIREHLYLILGSFQINRFRKKRLLQYLSAVIEQTPNGFYCFSIHFSSSPLVKNPCAFHKHTSNTSLLKLKQEISTKENEIALLNGNATVGVIKYNQAGKILSISESFLSILGYEQKSYLEKYKYSPFGKDIFHKEDQSIFEQALWKLRILSKKNTYCQCRILHQNNQYYWVDISIRTAAEHNKSFVYCYFTNFTKTDFAECIKPPYYPLQKEKLDELAQRNHQMQVILNAIKGGLKISYDDELYTYAYVSDELCRLFGYTKEEYLIQTGGTAVGAVYPPDLPRVMKECQLAFQDGALNYAIKYRIACKDGSLRWIIDSGKKVKNEDGKTIINSIYLDVTEIEEANQKITEQKELLDSIYDSILCGIVRYRTKDNNFEFVSMNKEAMKLLGYESQEECYELGLEEFYQRIHPQERETIQTNINQLTHINERFSCEYRVVTPQQKVSWVYGATELIQIQDGEMLLQRVMMDITDKKKLELELESERNRFRIALESTPAVIFEYDSQTDTYTAFGTLEEGASKHNIEYTIPNFLEEHLEHFVEKDSIDFIYHHFKTVSAGTIELKMFKYFGSQEFVWARLTTTPIIDDIEKSIRIIGRISNIQSEKEKEFALEEAKSKDSLTGLYTKDAGFKLIKEHLKNKSPQESCALLFLDMDDFSQLNEIEGSIFADAILQETAAIIYSQAKKDDITLRLGDDEFIVFVKNTTKEKTLALAQSIIQLIKGILFQKNKTITVSASMGICSTNEIEDFNGLYRCAEDTLKHVKKTEKGSFAYYLDTPNKNDRVLAQIYPQKQSEISSPLNHTEEDLTSFALELLGKAGNLDDAIYLLLARIGKTYHLERVSIMEVDHEYFSYQFSYQWAKNNQNLQTDRVFYASKEQLSQLEALYNKEGLCDCGLKQYQYENESCLHTAIYNHGSYAGCLCFEKEQPHFVWTKEHQKVIKELAKIIFSFILKARADAVSQAKTDFLSRMSHEIRTPMNAITGMTAIAKTVIDDKDRVLECLNKIESANSYLLSLINDILDMSRIESGKMELNYEAISLKKQLEEVTSFLMPQAQAKGIRMVIKNICLPQCSIMADALRLNQILINIIGNAIKFTSEGGTITVEASAQKEEAESVFIRFSVKDTGIGISPEEIGRIFNAFEQARRDICSQYGGTGLGLSISSRLVQMMGGTLEVTSQLGEGSEFFFSLKFAYAPENSITQIEQPILMQSEVNFQGKRILVAEDNELNREIAQTILEMNGFLVETAENGKQAVDLFLDKEPYYYDAILMDIRMPILDGLEATRRIRTSDCKDSRNIPIIAMSANAFHEDTKKSIESGMNGHLSKPIDIQALLKTLKRCFSQSDI